MISDLIKRIEMLDRAVKKIIVVNPEVMDELLSKKCPLNKRVRNPRNIEEISQMINEMLRPSSSLDVYQEKNTRDFSYSYDKNWGGGIHKAKFWIGLTGLKNLDTKTIAAIPTMRVFDAGGGGMGDHSYYADRILIEGPENFSYNKVKIREPIAVFKDELVLLGGERIK